MQAKETEYRQNKGSDEEDEETDEVGEEADDEDVVASVWCGLGLIRGTTSATRIAVSMRPFGPVYRHTADDACVFCLLVRLFGWRR